MTKKSISRSVSRGRAVCRKPFARGLAVLAVVCGLNACTQDRATETPNVGNPVLMLRLSMQNTSSEDVWTQTYSILKQNPGCCDEVWFSTGTGMPDMQVHRDHVSRLVQAKEALSNLGIGSSLQIQMTIGHGDQVGSELLLSDKISI